MVNKIRNILDILITLGGLAMGGVLSILSAIILLLSDVISLDHTTLALGWIMAAFVFAIGFHTTKEHMRAVFDQLGEPDHGG